jgi:hypothetical protein
MREGKAPKNKFISFAGLKPCDRFVRPKNKVHWSHTPFEAMVMG